MFSVFSYGCWKVVKEEYKVIFKYEEQYHLKKPNALLGYEERGVKVIWCQQTSHKGSSADFDIQYWRESFGSKPERSEWEMEHPHLGT